MHTTQNILLMHIENMGYSMNVTCLGNRRNKHNKNNNHKQVLPLLHNLAQAMNKINTNKIITTPDINRYA